MFFRFGSWIAYLGRDGFYVERLGSVHFLHACTNGAERHEQRCMQFIQ